MMSFRHVDRSSNRWPSFCLVSLLSLLLVAPIAMAQEADEQAQPAATLDEQPDQGVAESAQTGTAAAETATEATQAEEGDKEEEEEGPDIGPALGLSVIGVTSLVGGVLYLVDSGATEDDADAALAAGETLREQNLRDRADREMVLGSVLTALGVAAIGTATYLWIIAYSGDEAPEESSSPDVTLVPSIGPDGGAVFWLQGTF
ncbi:MAG: hypothetical protein JW797_03655 [Bradymonadales bacterium]|nr:hypothetical protein [Bradymonadales bacterium]